MKKQKRNRQNEVFIDIIIGILMMSLALSIIQFLKMTISNMISFPILISYGKVDLILSFYNNYYLVIIIMVLSAGFLLSNWKRKKEDLQEKKKK